MTGAKTFLEFFAGGGLARIGLGSCWQCCFANDIDKAKCASYRENFNDDVLVEGDVARLSVTELPAAPADLAWASFPCQDLSLAGWRGGMGAKRSSAFFPFWNLMKQLKARNAIPRIIVLENVVGTLTASNGNDFKTLCTLMTDAGYSLTGTIIDAISFTPQSRPRLFIIGLAPDCATDHLHATPHYDDINDPLTRAVHALPPPVRHQWRWMEKVDTRRNIHLADLLLTDACQWDSPAKTQALLAMMTERQHAKLAHAHQHGVRAGAAFRRTRIEDGIRRQRLEVRFDGNAGCLRTPAGGSSRQIVLSLKNGETRTRLLTAREAARLMGVRDSYKLPSSENAGLKIMGDGVCVPVVKWLDAHVLSPALSGKNRARIDKAA